MSKNKISLAGLVAEIRSRLPRLQSYVPQPRDEHDGRQRRLPKVTFIEDESMGSEGLYLYEKEEIVIYCKGRSLAEICSTLVHECTHWVDTRSWDFGCELAERSHTDRLDADHHIRAQRRGLDSEWVSYRIGTAGARSWHLTSQRSIRCLLAESTPHASSPVLCTRSGSKNGGKRIRGSSSQCHFPLFFFFTL